MAITQANAQAKFDVMANSKVYTQPKLYPTDRALKKTWWVEFRYLNPHTGKMQPKQFRDNLNELPTVKERLARAKILIRSYTDLLAEGWNPFSNNLENEREVEVRQLADELTHIIEVKRAACTKRTYQTYTDHRVQFAKWLKSNYYDRLLPKFFDGRKALTYADHCLKDRKYTGKTFNGHIGALRSFFNEMLARDIISKNPFNGIKKLPEVQNPHISFSNEERMLVRNHFKQNNKRLYYAVQFVYYCFLRRTELMQLKVGDIDLERKMIRVAGKIAKSRRSESITIPKSFEPILYEMGIDRLPKDYYLFGKGLQTCAEPLNKADLLTDAHRKELSSLNVRKDCTFYSWKHTGAMELYKATKDVYVVMKQCRHTDISITMIYLRSLGLIVDEVVRNADFEF